MCTIGCRSVSIVVILQFIANNMSTKVNNNTSEKEILKNINKLTTLNECQSSYDGDILDPIYPILRSSPEDTKQSINQQVTRLAKFYIDSGCSHHVVNDKSLLTTFVNPCPNYTMGKINGCTTNSRAKIMGYGSIEPLGNVLYAPQVIANLISVSQLTDNGFED